MEQNKVLMIIVSVAIFFAAVIGVGVALLYPGSDPHVAGGPESFIREFDPIEYVRRQDTAPLTEDDTDDPVIIVYGDTEPDEDAAPRALPREDRPDAEPDPDRDRPSEREREPAPERTTDASPQPTPDTPTTREPSPTPAATRDPEPTPTPAPREPAPRQVRVTEYWIQLIASPSRDRVSQAELALTDHNLGGRVTTRDVEGTMYYRLRVGPYDSKAEAEQALDWVRSIEGFGEAYISEEYPLRTVSG